MNSLNDHKFQMLRSIRSWSVKVAAASILAVGLAPAVNAADLIGVKYLPTGADQGRLLFTFDGAPPTPSSFGVESPARLALDFPDSSSLLAERRQEFDVGPIRNVVSAGAGGRLRVVVSMTSLVPYEVTTEGNMAIVWLNSSPGTQAAATKPAPAVQTARRTSSPSPVAAVPTVENIGSRSSDSQRSAPKEVRDVDFRRGVDGEGRLILTLSDGNILPNLRSEGSRIIIDLEGVLIADGLSRRYDVVDFGTPVTRFTLSPKEKHARLEIETHGELEQTAYKSGNQYVVEFHPLTEDEVAEKFPFGGERINLNFQNIEVSALLEIIADVANVNIVVSDSVKGNVTLRLNDVPWDQALDLVLTTKGLDKREAGNVIYVAPMAEIAAREKAELQNALENEELAALVTQLITLNYAKASDIAVLLKTRAGGSGEDDRQSAALLSSRGTVSVDERTNTLLVYESPEKLEQIHKLVRDLDVPVRQVLIESRIVVANNNFTSEIGVRFGATTAQPAGSGAIGITGSGAGAAGLVESFRTGGFPVTPPALSDRLAVSLPTAGAAGTLGMAILSSDYLLDLELSALQAEGNGEIVSNPRVITANQQTASIEQGVEVPFQTASEGGTQVQFKKATLSLEVTPLITPDGRVLMDLIVSKDNIGVQVPSGVQGGFIPSIDTRSVKTQVLVEDGETVVLGGIYEATKAHTQTKVPVLGDLPLIGGLFRSKRKTDDKTELLIFVTPRVLREGLQADY